MFRIEYIRIKNHPQLGDLEIDLIELNELNSNSSPYLSVVIGSNGTGKSYLLKTIAEIFRQLDFCKIENRKSLNIPFDFDFQYYLNDNQYRIVQNKIPNKRNKILNIYKNSYSFDYLNQKGNFVGELKKSIISINDVELPAKLIVNSVMLNDRFIWQKSKPNDFYQYLGARNTRTTSSTKSAVRRTIAHLFNATTTQPNFVLALKELLSFLDFQENFLIHYSTKINKLFFSGELTILNFKKYFEFWWDESFIYSKRKEENPLWSIPYYNKHFKNNEKATKGIVNYLNKISTEENRLIKKYRSSSKIISVNLFDEQIIQEELELIIHLENLDIINLDSIKINKNNSLLSINEISSGEYHLMISLIGIFSKIKNNSIVLMDEPEISLHPNWQMKYISFLKKVFNKYFSCHFIISTHSHFLISDLESKSSSVIVLKRNSKTDKLTAELLKGKDTYGWSAEEILYNVFNVKTVRNHFLEADLTDLLGLISEKSKDKEKIQTLLNAIKSLNISENDPLNAVIIEANAYLEEND